MKKESNKKILIHIDTLPNVLKIPGQAKQHKQFLRDKLEKEMDDMIKRYTELPACIVHLGEYSDLLREARELYIEGKYYSCVAMCGITAEKIAKDLLRTVTLFRKDKKGFPPNPAQLKQLNRIELDIIRELLVQTSTIEEYLRKPFEEIAKLRNKYAHGTGKQPKEDSKNAISYLHEIVEGSVSVFKHYELKAGQLVAKK